MCDTHITMYIFSVFGVFKTKTHFWLHHTAHCAEKIVCALAHWFCVTRKGGTGGGAWGHPQGAVHMVAARLGFEKAMVGTGRATPRPDCIDRLIKLLSPCRGLVSGKKGCLGSEWVYGN